MKPATPTIYTMSFTPVNPIPPTGSIQISWPTQVSIEPDVICTVTTNRVWTGKCNVDMSRSTLTITDVFSSETTDFYSPVEVELNTVTNPLNNKEDGLGFSIFTYTDS